MGSQSAFADLTGFYLLSNLPLQIQEGDTVLSFILYPGFSFLSSFFFLSFFLFFGLGYFIDLRAPFGCS